MQHYPVGIDELFFESFLIANKWLDHERSFLLIVLWDAIMLFKISSGEWRVE